MTPALGSRPMQGHGKVRVNGHTHIPGSAKKCEGIMSPHTFKWTPILGIEVPMDSRIFKEQFERSTFIKLKSSLYIRRNF